MRISTLFRAVFVGAAVCALAIAQVAVVTYHNDNLRTGLNNKETVLTPSNVHAKTFGKLFVQAVDGQVYAQPLYVPGVAIPGKGTHNVVFVATENDSIYAFDADNNTGANASPLWKAAFANPAQGITPISSSTLGCDDLTPQVGITGTPVIVRSTATMFVVAKTQEVVSGVTSFYQRLHAIDLQSGAEKLGGPFVVSASVPGNCYPNVNGNVNFDAKRQHQRAGLALSNSTVYVGWASHCDNNPYTGWMMAFSATTGAPTGVFNTAPNMGTLSYECRSGIWQGGAAPAVDSTGNLFFATGNGYFNANSGGNDYGDSVLKLKPSGGSFSVTDYFAPYNQDSLDAADLDLGSGGVLLLPDQAGPNPHLAVNVGKEGTIYLLNRDNLGKYNAGGDSQIVQSLPNAIGGVWGVPAYFGTRVYFGGEFDAVKAFKLTNGLLGTSPDSQTPTSFGYPGPGISVSANGTTAGIVWVLDSQAWGSGGAAVLHAYDATNLSRELYNTKAKPRDQLGPAVKFAVPTIANGKVYVGTGNSLAVLGPQ
ncbi:MAG: hypothetical protein U0Q18_22970 [Bryobacteraceae bacterium]